MPWTAEQYVRRDSLAPGIGIRTKRQPNAHTFARHAVPVSQLINMHMQKSGTLAYDSICMPFCLVGRNQVQVRTDGPGVSHREREREREKSENNSAPNGAK